MGDLLYLDNHATTPVDPRVAEVMMSYFSRNFGNPSSHSHRAGLEAEKAVEEARRLVAALVGASPREIFFTSGATEANNQVLKGVMEVLSPRKNHLIISSTEHKCVLESARYLASRGIELTFLKADSRGMTDPDDLAAALTPRTALVSVIMANNEVGTINPVEEMGQICRNRGVLFHVDAAQAVGKLPLDLRSLAVDFLTSSAHKFYGPKGAGFLYVRRAWPTFELPPLLHGGGQEAGLRSGTLNVPGIVGLGAAARLAGQDFARDFFHLGYLRNRLWRLLQTELGDLVDLNGEPLDPQFDSLPSDPKTAPWPQKLTRLPGNLNFTVRGLDRDRFFKLIRDVALSYGSACASGDLSLSHVLLAMGLPPERIQSSLRAGLGRFNTADEVDRAAEIIIRGIKSTQRP